MRSPLFPDRRSVHARTRKRAIALTVLATVLAVPMSRPAGADIPEGRFVAVGGMDGPSPACDTGRSATSSDLGLSWPTSATAFTPTTPAPCFNGGELYDVAQAGGVLVAVGSKQLPNGTAQGISFRSTNNGASWIPGGTVPATPAGEVGLKAIATNGSGVWVAGGYRGLYRSLDQGSSWTKLTFFESPQSWEINDIAEQPGSVEDWTAVGSVHPVGVPNRNVLSLKASANLNFWSDLAMAAPGSSDRELLGVAYRGNGRKVAVGSVTLPGVWDPGEYAPITLASNPLPYYGYQLLDSAQMGVRGAGRLEGVAVDVAGNFVAVGTKTVNGSDKAKALHWAQQAGPYPSSPWTDVSSGLPATINSLRSVATDGFGSWVAVGGDRGATTRSSNFGTTWGPEVQVIPALKGEGLLRSVVFRG